MPAITTEMLRHALRCLYAPTELANSELSRALPDVDAVSDVLPRAQSLRSKLLYAIEVLRPSGSAGRQAPSASAARAYDCLRLRYVSGLEVEAVARQLALSARQVNRDLHWAEEQLAQLLQSEGGDAATTAAPRAAWRDPAGPDAAAGGSPLEQEIKALAGRPEPAHLLEIAQSAVDIVAGLAARQGTRLRLEQPEAPILVSCVPPVLRQVLVLLLSAALQSGPRRREAGPGAAGDELLVVLRQEPEAASVCLPAYEGGDEGAAARVRSAFQVVEAQGWGREAAPGSPGEAPRLCLRLPLAKRRRVLVVEDNPGAYALFERYLASSEWEVVPAPRPRLAVDLAIARQVEAILLDLMMAETDGWTLLQSLKLSPRTRHLPVVICSIVNDPDLGMALGASACLTKPVSRRDLLRALRQVTRDATRQDEG
jgi:CheY-like chemotaxis protein